MLIQGNIFYAIYTKREKRQVFRQVNTTRSLENWMKVLPTFGVRKGYYNPGPQGSQFSVTLGEKKERGVGPHMVTLLRGH